MASKRRYTEIRGYHSGVTGSCIRVTHHKADKNKFRCLIDDGMYQGENVKKLSYNDCVTPSKINAVFLTHTHLDHDGALPAFVKQGYNGTIYMSNASLSVLDIGLLDSYTIMKHDAKIKKQPILFSPSDITKTIGQIVSYPYEKEFSIDDGINAVFFKNNHLPGASMILLQFNDEPDGQINLLFTGDYRPTNIFFEDRDLPSWVYELPNLTIITEATYGTTNSSEIKATWEDDIVEAVKNNKIIFNCAFGQGRAQELLYRLKLLQDKGLIPKDYPIYLDGSSAISYTYRYLDRADVLGIKEEARNFLPSSLSFVHAKSRPTIMQNSKGKIIISTSGMGTHGPAATYIQHFITNPNVLIYFPGYTAEGTMGRKILEAENGESIQFLNGRVSIKRADVRYTGEFSSHAKADELISFLNRFHPTSVLINHGEPEVKKVFRERVKEELGLPARKVGILGMGFVYRIKLFGIDKEIKK